MNKYTINRNILLMQMLISSLVAGVIVYFVYPFIEENKALIGTYYAVTTILSFFIGIAVESLMIKIYECKKEKAKREALESTPTQEHEAYRNKLIIKERNKKIEDYQKNFDNNI